MSIQQIKAGNTLQIQISKKSQLKIDSPHLPSMTKTEPQIHGRWTKLEHQKFMLGLQLYGKNWKKIEELVVSRTGSQIRSHAQKYFIKSKKEYMEPTTEDTANPIPAEVLTMAPAVVSGCSEHSYFMAAIMRASVQQDFNFWQQLIDLNSARGEPQIGTEVTHKDSFASFDGCYDSKQETGIFGAVSGDCAL